MKQVKWILASDIDHTLTGDAQALKELNGQIKNLRERGSLYLFLTTGRTLDEVLNGFEQENIPVSDAVITQVGTEIFTPPYSPHMQPLPEWEAFLREKFSREKAEEFLKDIEGAEIQPERYNTPLKVSYFLNKAPDPEQAAAQIQQRIREDGGSYQVVWSSGKHLDILPGAAGKGNAIRFLIRFLKLAPGQVITAGDSGNDYSMMEEFGQGIIVGNAQPELKKLREADHQAAFYFAKNFYAAGVVEGLRHFGVLQ